MLNKCKLIGLLVGGVLSSFSVLAGDGFVGMNLDDVNLDDANTFFNSISQDNETQVVPVAKEMPTPEVTHEVDATGGVDLQGPTGDLAVIGSSWELGTDKIKSQASKSRKQGSGLYYLKNIPTSSMLVFKERSSLLPRENTLHFEGGKRVFSEPSSSSTLKSLCIVKLSQSGLGRTIRKDNSYKITDVQSREKSYQVEGLGTINKQELIFIINDEHVKSVSCMSTQKSTDMNVSDLREITGGILDIELRKYLEI